MKFLREDTENQVDKIVVYKITNGLEVYYFHFLFNQILVTWSKWVHKHFPQLAEKSLRSTWDFQIFMTIYIPF